MTLTLHNPHVCGRRGKRKNKQASVALPGISHNQGWSRTPAHHTSGGQGCPSRRKCTDLDFRYQSKRSDPNGLLAGTPELSDDYVALGDPMKQTAQKGTHLAYTKPSLGPCWAFSVSVKSKARKGGEILAAKTQRKGQ